MRVLIVEDDVPLATQLEKGLREQGYLVVHQCSFRDGLQRAVTGEYDLLIRSNHLPVLQNPESVSWHNSPAT